MPSLIESYRANRAAHPDASARTAFVWAQSETRKQAFFAGFANLNRSSFSGKAADALEGEGLELAGYSPSDCFGEVLKHPSGLACLVIWEAADNDSPGDDHRPDWSEGHHSFRAFLAGETDYLSSRESHDFYERRGHRSYKVRADYEGLRDYHAKRGASRMVAEELARAGVLALVRSYESEGDESRYGYGLEAFYRNESGAWVSMGEADGPIWGCAGYDDARAAVWEHFNPERALAEALEAGRIRQAARAFAGV